MEVRPGYKQTEVGVIPKEWHVVPLGNLVHITSGESPRLFRFTPDGVPYFKVEQLSNAEKHLHSSSTPYHFQEGKTVASGSVVFAKRGAAIALNKVRILSQESFMDTNLMALSPKESLDSEFLFYRLSFVGLWKFADTTSVPQINNKHVKPLDFPLPGIPEQRAIADALGDMDELLCGLDRLIAKKRDLKQAAMQQLLTGKTRLPGFSGEWPVKMFAEMFNFSGGYSASRNQLSTKGHCYLHYGDIHTSSKTFLNVSAEYQDIPKLDIPLKRVPSTSLLKDGDVVFVDASEDDAGTSKHVVVVNKENLPFISGLHTIVAKSKTDELAHSYRRYCFQTPALRQQFLFYAVGTKVSGISKSNIAKLKMPVPSFAEQTAIAEVLSDMDAELEALGKRLEKTRALKQAMMQELLTGNTRLV